MQEYSLTNLRSFLAGKVDFTNPPALCSFSKKDLEVLLAILDLASAAIVWNKVPAGTLNVEENALLRKRVGELSALLNPQPVNLNQVALKLGTPTEICTALYAAREEGIQLGYQAMRSSSDPDRYLKEKYGDFRK